ncbi:unannotated protein [freshwater metagenome]|uniref:Unannotated protein n=1 Tax=freshwater metagenome TaxID=449393 RepID=A0A6J6XFT0_9ZZZZ
MSLTLPFGVLCVVVFVSALNPAIKKMLSTATIPTETTAKRPGCLNALRFTGGFTGGVEFAELPRLPAFAM